MTLKEVKENYRTIFLDIKKDEGLFANCPVTKKNNTYALIKNVPVKWEDVHRAVNSWYHLNLKKEGF